MPLTSRDLPPDHPLFTQGVSFVFRSDPPPEEQQYESEHDDDAAPQLDQPE